MRFRGLTLGLTAALMVTLATPARLSQEANQKCDFNEAAFELPSSWTVFNLEVEGCKARIQAKVDDGTINANSGKNSLELADNLKYKALAFAPRGDQPVSSNVSLIVNAELGTLEDEQTAMAKAAADAGQPLLKNEIKDHVLRFIARHDPKGRSPIIVDQVVWKPDFIVYILTFACPISDQDAMEPVVEQAIKTFQIKDIFRQSRR